MCDGFCIEYLRGGIYETADVRNQDNGPVQVRHYLNNVHATRDVRTLSLACMGDLEIAFLQTLCLLTKLQFTLRAIA